MGINIVCSCNPVTSHSLDHVFEVICPLEGHRPWFPFLTHGIDEVAWA